MEAEKLFEKCGGIEDKRPADLQEFSRLMAVDDPFNTLKVIARAKPDHKEAIINGLRDIDRKVVAIGKGLNDVESLRAANVSFALGGGCALARLHSTMVLITDEFKSLAKSILWGRNMYVNVKRFLTFQLSCNFSVLIIVFIGYIKLAESPLNAI